MKKKKKKGDDIFARFFYFIAENGYTKVTYPESWDKKEQRDAIIKKENEKET